MRIYFKSLTRPKHLALRLNILIPGLSLMRAQDWISKILGYRNWHELAQCVGPDAIEIPDFGKGSLDDDRAAIRKVAALRDVLARLVGDGYTDDDVARLFRYINPIDPTARLKRLGKLSAGKPCFKGLEYDLFEREGEAAGSGGGECYEIWDGLDDLHIYLGIPTGREEGEFLTALASSLRRRKMPYRGYAQNLISTLSGHDKFGVTVLDTEPYDEDEDVEAGSPSILLATQSRGYRFFLLDGDTPIGAISLEIDITAATDNDALRVTVTVDEGWVPSPRKSVYEAIVLSLAAAVADPLRRLRWFQIQNPVVEIEVNVETESESQFTWDLVSALHHVLPQALAEGKLAELPKMSFHQSICP